MKFPIQIIFIVLTILTASTEVFAENPLKQLQKLTAQFKKNPTDDALRIKIIKLAKNIKPSPPISENAVSSLEKGNLTMKNAKDASGFELSIAAFKESVISAPWWGEAYFGLAEAQDAENKYADAIATLKIYQLTLNSESADVQEIQNKIYSLEAKIELALKSKKAPQIIAGKSIGNIEIGMSPEKLRELLGAPSKSDSTEPWQQNLWWKTTGFKASVKTSLNAVDSVQVSDMATQYRTAEGIGIGTPESEIIPKIGEPDRDGRLKNEEKILYCYRSGLKLIATQGKVSQIEVFRPSGFNDAYCELQMFE